MYAPSEIVRLGIRNIKFSAKMRHVYHRCVFNVFESLTHLSLINSTRIRLACLLFVGKLLGYQSWYIFPIYCGLTKFNIWKLYTINKKAGIESKEVIAAS